MCLTALAVHGPAVCSATVKMGQSTSEPESQEPPEVSTLPRPISNTDYKHDSTCIHAVSVVTNNLNHNVVLLILLHQQTALNKEREKTFFYIY